MFNITKAGKNEIQRELFSQINAQDLMTILMQHLDNSNKSDAEKLATIRNYANAWYDMATHSINDCTRELARREAAK